MSYNRTKSPYGRDYYDNLGSLSTKTSSFRGAGDVVAAMTKAVGIQPCTPCKKRQVWLNQVLPFRRSR